MYSYSYVCYTLKAWFGIPCELGIHIYQWEGLHLSAFLPVFSSLERRNSEDWNPLFEVFKNQAEWRMLDVSVRPQKIKQLSHKPWLISCYLVCQWVYNLLSLQIQLLFCKIDKYIEFNHIENQQIVWINIYLICK